MNKKNLAAAVGAALSCTLAAAPLAAAEANPFGLTELGAGYMLGAAAGMNPEDAKVDAAKDAEGKCGEGKCGKDKAAKDAAAATAADGEEMAADDAKAKEGNCGEDKAAKGEEGKCGG